MWTHLAHSQLLRHARAHVLPPEPLANRVMTFRTLIPPGIGTGEALPDRCRCRRQPSVGVLVDHDRTLPVASAYAYGYLERRESECPHVGDPCRSSSSTPVSLKRAAASSLECTPSFDRMF